MVSWGDIRQENESEEEIDQDIEEEINKEIDKELENGFVEDKIIEDDEDPDEETFEEEEFAEEEEFEEEEFSDGGFYMETEEPEEMEEVQLAGKKKKHSVGKAIGKFLLGLLIFLVVAYLGISAFFIKHFYVDTKINGSDFSLHFLLFSEHSKKIY